MPTHPPDQAEMEQAVKSPGMHEQGHRLTFGSPEWAEVGAIRTTPQTEENEEKREDTASRHSTRCQQTIVMNIFTQESNRLKQVYCVSFLNTLSLSL